MICIKKLIPFMVVAVISVILIAVTEYADRSEPSSADVPSVTIIIDAGHGGVDGGAVAKDGTQEKNINLDIALRMNEYLKAQGYKTVLTRDGDYSIHDENADTIRKKKVSDLHNRLKIINNTENAIFVSVHQNYFTESKYYGTQVFYSVNNNKSMLLADFIQQSVVDTLQPDNTRKIKQSGKDIFLLYNSQIPSVLVECGFLSNTTETDKLNDEKYRQQMAESVCCGIINYLNSSDETSSTVVRE